MYVNGYVWFNLDLSSSLECRVFKTDLIVCLLIYVHLIERGQI